MAVIVHTRHGTTYFDTSNDEVLFIDCSESTGNLQPCDAYVDQFVADPECEKEQDEPRDLNPDCRIRPASVRPVDRERARQGNRRATTEVWKLRRRMRRLARSTCG